MSHVQLSCDGLDGVLDDGVSSLHIRIGLISLAHTQETRCGSFSIHNAVVGFRAKPSHANMIEEQLIFGPNSDPLLWQWAVDTYPEKLLSVALATDKCPGRALLCLCRRTRCPSTSAQPTHKLCCEVSEQLGYPNIHSRQLVEFVGSPCRNSSAPCPVLSSTSRRCQSVPWLIVGLCVDL
ncbi:hypothetical protein PINS_up022879 [Pythium insidiosum]|nr:hypothetical protein PINS_up022879 [Pythium insidiosum]